MKGVHPLAMYYGATYRLFEFAKQMRLRPTLAEDTLWKALNAEPFKQYNFRRQHPIAGFIADFYCHSLKLVIEVDGGIHRAKDQKQYDDFRDSDMQKLGISVLRFTNEQVLNQVEKVKQQITNTIKSKKNGC